MSDWINHVKSVQEKHGITYREALKEAKKTYKASGKTKTPKTKGKRNTTPKSTSTIPKSLNKATGEKAQFRQLQLVTKQMYLEKGIKGQVKKVNPTHIREQLQDQKIKARIARDIKKELAEDPEVELSDEEIESIAEEALLQRKTERMNRLVSKYGGMN